jgi:hypothetical protein
MTIAFYRYIRPTAFDSKRAELVTSPYGGVCLRFEQLDNGRLWFTHSRCDPSNLFSKEVAKNIADDRATFAKRESYQDLGYCGDFKFTTKIKDLLGWVIQWSDSWVPESREPAILYHAFELKELASALVLIDFVNTQQAKLADDWKTSMTAAQYGEMYGNLQD